MKKGIWISLGGIALLAIGINTVHINNLSKPVSEQVAATVTQSKENKEDTKEEKIVSQNKEKEGTVLDQVYQAPSVQEKDQQTIEEQQDQANEKVQEEQREKENQTAPVDPSALSNAKREWWFRRNTKHLPPTAQGEINIDKYDAHYLGNTEKKVVYLTFDEGYENGFTPSILDTLKENNVKAAFFVTGHYIESQPDLVKRMVEEGHVVGNHSIHHPDLTEKSDKEVNAEINGLAEQFKELTGKEMPHFFRPPEGAYSERTLALTQKNGYKTIFWSMAYQDWLVDQQPGKEAAYQHVMDNYHPGAIILLHAVSESNTEALDQIIKDLRKEGYEFASLNDLP